MDLMQFMKRKILTQNMKEVLLCLIWYSLLLRFCNIWQKKTDSLVGGRMYSIRIYGANIWIFHCAPVCFKI